MVVMKMREEVEIDVAYHAVLERIHDKSGASNTFVIRAFDVFAQL